MHAWTIDDPAVMGRLIDRGVDGIITNDPAAAVAVRSEREGCPSGNGWFCGCKAGYRRLKASGLRSSCCDRSGSTARIVARSRGRRRHFGTTTAHSDEERGQGVGFHQLAGLVQVVIDDRGRIDAEGVIDRGQELAGMDGI